MCKAMEIRKSVKKADGDECVCLVVDKVSGGKVWLVVPVRVILCHKLRYKAHLGRKKIT